MTTRRSRLWAWARDPFWQFAGVVVALVIGVLTLVFADPDETVSGNCNAVGSGNVVDC